MFMQNASHQSRNFHWGLVGKKSFDGTSEMCLDRLKGRGGALNLWRVVTIYENEAEVQNSPNLGKMFFSMPEIY